VIVRFEFKVVVWRYGNKLDVSMSYLVYIKGKEMRLDMFVSYSFLIKKVDNLAARIHCVSA
jgi:hypothetical protein